MQSPDEYSAERISAALALRTLRLFDNKAAAPRVPSAATVAVSAPPNAVGSHSARVRSASVTPFDLFDPIHRRFERGSPRVTPQRDCRGLRHGENRIWRTQQPSQSPRALSPPCNRVALHSGGDFHGTVHRNRNLSACGAEGRNSLHPARSRYGDRANSRRFCRKLRLSYCFRLNRRRPVCPARRARAISVESEIESIECGNGSNFPRSAAIEGPGSAAVYSFSGGRKGQALSHRACIDSIDSLRAALCLTPMDRFVATMQPDLALCGLWILGPLVYGARLILAAAHEEISDFPFDEIEQSRAVILQATIPIATALLRGRWQVRGKLKFVCGADTWPGDLLTRLEEEGVEVWQLQGSAASYQVFRSSVKRSGLSVVVG